MRTRLLTSVLVLASVQAYTFGFDSNGIGLLRIARDGTPLTGSTVAQHTGYANASDHANTMTLMALDQPGSSGPFTYAVQAKQKDGTFSLNKVSGQSPHSNIIAQEF